LLQFVTSLLCLAQHFASLSVFALHNYQACRVDYLLDKRQNKALSIPLKQVLGYIPNKSIHHLFTQQVHDFFAYKNVSMLVLDSFCELTMQAFSSPKGGRFCSLWRWINHDGDFDSVYKSEGLLDLEKLEDLYDQFFGECVKTYGKVPIVFVHFPSTFETREHYKARASKIVEVIHRLSLKYETLIPIEMDYARKGDEDDYPYHFSDDTFGVLASKLASLNLLSIKGIKP
jgi:hypothetical protein